MKRRGTMRAWTIAALTCALLAAVATGALAQTDALDDPGEPGRAIGVIGAIGCGTEFALIRTVPVIGMNPFVLGAGIGFCLLMVMDMFT